MDSKKNKKNASLIIKQLNIILSNNDKLSSLFSNKDFSTIIKKQIEMLMQLEEKEKNKKYTDYIDKFNILLSHKIEGPKKTNYKEETEFLDEINYLPIYIKNSYNIDILQMKTSKEKVDDISNLEKNTQDQSFGNKSNSSSNSNQDQYFQNNPYGNPEFYKENIISQMINKRIGDDFIKGNYYFFNSKPKIIPIVRFVSGLFLIVAAILLLVQIILNITVINMGIYIVIKEEQVKYSQDWMSYILYIIQSLVMFYAGYGMMKKIKNDNLKYKPNNFIYYIVFFLGVFSLYNSIIGVTNYSWLYDASKNTSEVISLYKSFKIIGLVYNCLLFLFIIFPIVNYVYRPQENKELRIMLYEKYRKEIEDLGLVK